MGICASKKPKKKDENGEKITGHASFKSIEGENAADPTSRRAGESIAGMVNTIQLSGTNHQLEHSGTKFLDNDAPNHLKDTKKLTRAPEKVSDEVIKQSYVFGRVIEYSKSFEDKSWSELGNERSSDEKFRDWT